MIFRAFLLLLPLLMPLDPDPVGACWKGVGCELLNEAVCEEMCGEWAGPFTRCVATTVP